MSSRPSPSSTMTSSQARRATADADRAQKRRKSAVSLRVLEGGSANTNPRLSPRQRLVGLVAMVCVVLFGVVSFHVVLSQSEFKLEKLSDKADKQQDQYQRLRLQVSQLESASRITSEAQSQLGMVSPDKVTTVTPGAGDMPRTASGSPIKSLGSGLASSDTTDDPGNWAKVKSQLNSDAQ
jgi:cell division protein FtsL